MPADVADYTLQSPETAARFARIRQREVILSVQDLKKSFVTNGTERVVFDHLSFDVHRREFITIILLSGVPVTGPGPDRGMVFQGYTLFPWLSVKRNVMFGLQMKGRSDIEAESLARQWIAMVGLEKFEDSYPHELSGGMKQRVAIARALANEPRVLIMDEPFGALDSQTRAKMQAHLIEIWKKVDITILFITHDLDEAILLSDRVLVLGVNPGGLVEFIENPVPRPRSPKQITSPEFIALKARLDELIHPPQPEGEEEITIPPMVKLTVAGDEVE